MNHKTLKNSQGFTLVEMMVAVSIFSSSSWPLPASWITSLKARWPRSL